MNMEKTKVIWVGQKRFCKEKLNVKFKLECGNTEFSMLGLHFSTNLKDIPYINFTETLRKIKKEMGNWKSRLLTPFGRITLIKTLFLPKLIHLFMSLPVPIALLQEINSLMYEFLWDSKPDKVKRKTICAKYSNGGLRMTDSFNFEKVLKLSWIRKIVQQTNLHWRSLLIDNGYNINSIPIMGGSYPFYSRLQENKFWNQVLDYWKTFCEKQQPTSNIHILNSCLWYNFQLLSYPLFLRIWNSNGI